VDMPELARIWTNGCIIRSDLMQEAMGHLKEKGDLLRCEDVVSLIRKQKSSLQNTVAALSLSHRAYPCLMSALATLNGLTTAHSAAHLIQAQRDFFGAHLYERTDDASGKKYHTEWGI
jgi:6-phosphogluconate dehydrogenase